MELTELFRNYSRGFTGITALPFDVSVSHISMTSPPADLSGPVIVRPSADLNSAVSCAAWIGGLDAAIRCVAANRAGRRIVVSIDSGLAYSTWGRKFASNSRCVA
jgi:hypothetical protein